jgi:DNA repair exonuclease SbcCD nuclease subunit
MVEKIYVVLGNHDYTNLNLVDHAFNFDANKIIKNLEIISKSVRDLDDNLQFVPYMEDKSFGWVETGNEKDALMFCHQPFTGFFYNVTSKVGETNGVDVDKVKGFKKVIAGHFHSFQEKGNIIYLGTPFAHTFAEANEEKKIMVIDENREISYLSTKGILPQYYAFKVGLKELTQGKKFEYNQNDFVKFVVEDNELNCKIVTKDFITGSMQENKIPKCDNVYIQYDYTDNKIDIQISEDDSVVKMFQDYVNLHLKDYEFKNSVLKLGVERYLKNASL